MRLRPVRSLLIAFFIAAAAIVVVFHPDRPLYMRHRDGEVASIDGVRLAVTLSTPRWGRKPFPAVVVVHGSGPIGREHSRGDTRRLVRQRFAVVAYDKRGTGESGGRYASISGRVEAQLQLLATDAAAVFKWAAQQQEVDASRLGFFGASQAGWIIPIASELVHPRFNVILSGPAVSTGIEMHFSMMTGDGSRPPRVSDQNEIVERTRAFSGERGFDPAPYLTRAKTPTLWLLGERDVSVPTFATVEVIEQIRRAGNRAHTVIVYQSAGHDLRDVATGEEVPLWRDLRSWLGAIGVKL